MSRTFTFTSVHHHWGRIMDVQYSYRLNPKYDGCENKNKFIIFDMITDGVKVDVTNLTWMEREALREQIEVNLTQEEKTVLRMREDRGSPKVLDFIKTLLGCKP